MHNRNVLFLTQAAMIAAVYVVLTFLANALGLANFAIQLRFSEALTILPYFTAAAVPGLAIGCLIANILTGCALPDIIFGTLATLLGALGTYALRKHKWLTPLPPIIANTIIVPLVFLFGYGMRIGDLSILACFAYFAAFIAAGEILSCGVLGLALLFALQRYGKRIFPE